MAKTVKCPTCQKDVEWNEQSKWRPFCSERCRLIDLGQWLEEDYRVAGDSVPNGDMDNNQND